MDCSPPGPSVLHYHLEFTQTVEPFCLQDAERENRKESYLDVPWEASPSWFLLLYGPWRVWVTRLWISSHRRCSEANKGPWQDPLESDLLVRSNTEDVQVLSCGSFHPGLLQGAGWHGRESLLLPKFCSCCGRRVVYIWTYNPLQYSCLENPLDRGVWWATVHGVAKSQTRLKQLNTHTQIYIIYKLN